MPQTSPMTWLILSSMIPTTMTSLFSFLSFNNHNMPNQISKQISKKNFNWTW